MTVESSSSRVNIGLAKLSAETDSTEISSLVSDFDGAQSFRAETIAYIRECIVRDERHLSSESAKDPTIASFHPIGEAISKSCTTSKQQIPFSHGFSRAYICWQRRPRPSSRSYCSILT